METKEFIHKNNPIFGIIAFAGLVISCIFIVRTIEEGKFYDALANKDSITSVSLADKVHDIEQTMQANEAVKNHDYEEALALISGSSSEDYYNRGIIQILMAYEHALESSVSGLEAAQTFIAQAQQNFTIAKKLDGPIGIKEAIANNQETITALSSVVDIKNCYSIGKAIITNITDIDTTIQTIKDTLSQEEIYVNKRMDSLDKTCQEKLSYIINTSKEQVALLKMDMQDKKDIYLNDFSERIDDPILCIQSPYKNILPIIVKGKEGLQAYQKLHQNTVDALKSNDKKLISDLCNETKNDAELNQQIEDAIQELLQTLTDNTLENQKNQRNTNKKQYKDFFTEDEKRILEAINKINQGWIGTVLNIRGKEDYDAQNYLNNLFNQFYGNTGDFIDLHK